MFKIYVKYFKIRNNIYSKIVESILKYILCIEKKLSNENKQCKFNFFAAITCWET